MRAESFASELEVGDLSRGDEWTALDGAARRGFRGLASSAHFRIISGYARQFRRSARRLFLSFLQWYSARIQFKAIMTLGAVVQAGAEGVIAS